MPAAGSSTRKAWRSARAASRSPATASARARAPRLSNRAAGDRLIVLRISSIRSRSVRIRLVERADQDAARSLQREQQVFQTRVVGIDRRRLKLPPDAEPVESHTRSSVRSLVLPSNSIVPVSGLVRPVIRSRKVVFARAIRADHRPQFPGIEVEIQIRIALKPEKALVHPFGGQKEWLWRGLRISISPPRPR